MFSHGALSKPPANARPPSSPKFIRAHDIMGRPPTPLASVLLLQLLSHPLTALKKKDTSTCHLWMSLWPHISARPQLSDERRGRAIRLSHAEPHLHSLDAPTRWLDKRLQRFTRWLCSRSSMLVNEEAGLDSASLRDLRSVTDLPLRTTKATAQAIRPSMFSLIVLEHHL